MNTLSKQYTGKFFASQEDYDAFRKYWSSLVNSDKKYELKALHHFVYLVLCGKDYRKGFIASTNVTKLDNGYQNPLVSIMRSIKYMHYYNRYDNILEIFGGTITKEALEIAKTLLPNRLGGDAYVAITEAVAVK